MRPLATGAVVAALVLLGLLALVDALRPDAEMQDETTTERRASQPPPGAATGPPAIEGRDGLAGGLAAARIAGTLYFTDSACRLWALRLPEVEWLWTRSAPAGDCSFALSPSGEEPLFGRAAWSPAGDLGAVDVTSVLAGAAVEVLSSETGWAHRFRGAGPAFRPDGTLTFVRNGALWEWAEGECARRGESVVFRGRRATTRCARHLLSRESLRRALLRSDVGLADPSFAEVVWLDQRTLVALVRGRRTGVALVVFDGGRWRASGTAFVVATDSSIFLVRPGERQGRLIEIPVAARDVAWRD